MNWRIVTKPHSSVTLVLIMSTKTLPAGLRAAAEVTTAVSQYLPSWYPCFRPVSPCDRPGPRLAKSYRTRAPLSPRPNPHSTVKPALVKPALNQSSTNNQSISGPTYYRLNIYVRLLWHDIVNKIKDQTRTVVRWHITSGFRTKIQCACLCSSRSCYISTPSVSS